MHTDPSFDRLKYSLLGGLRLLCMVLAMLGLSACGNKGDLYLPEKDQQKEEQSN